MHLHIQRREVEGIAVLSLDGKIVLGGEASAFRDTLSALATEGANRVILDLQAVTFIDSSGLGVLVAGHSDFDKTGGGLRLLHLTKRSSQLLVLTKLSAVFRIFDDEQAAIDSFFPDRQPRTFDILEFVTRHGEEAAHAEQPEAGITKD